MKGSLLQNLLMVSHETSIKTEKESRPVPEFGMIDFTKVLQHSAEQHSAEQHSMVLFSVLVDEVCGNGLGKAVDLCSEGNECTVGLR